MINLDVEILSAKKDFGENAVIQLKSKRDINIVRFMNLVCNDEFSWELCATRKVKEIDFEELKKRFSSGKYVRFVKPLSRFQINKEKRCIFLQLNNEKITIKCDKEDKFDWKIGLGLAISKLNDNAKYKAHRDLFRDKKTHMLDIKKYTYWVLTEFYHNDMWDLGNLEKRVKNTKEMEFIEL